MGKKLGLEDYDIFGASVPLMTLEGKQVVGTHIGFIATLLVSTAMLAFGCLQAFIVLTHNNPSISISETSDAFLSKTDQLNVTDDFFVGITVQDGKTKELLYDEQLVRFMAEISEGDGISMYTNKIEIGTHRCSEKDFEKMNNASRASEHSINVMKEKNQLFCLNETDVNGFPYNLTFYGVDDFTPHRRIEWKFMPCLSYKNLTKSKDPVTCKGSV